jgi:hypothetical protein
MSSKLKNFLSVFLIVIVGISGIGNSYFSENTFQSHPSEIDKVAFTDSIPGFDKGLEFSSSKINVPGFKALDTCFDLVSDCSGFLFAVIINGGLKAKWIENDHNFFSVHALLFPFHYFW